MQAVKTFSLLGKSEPSLVGKIHSVPTSTLHPFGGVPAAENSIWVSVSSLRSKLFTNFFVMKSILFKFDGTSAVDS